LTNLLLSKKRRREWEIETAEGSAGESSINEGDYAWMNSSSLKG
jgi:hypothetical protein